MKEQKVLSRINNNAETFSQKSTPNQNQFHEFQHNFTPEQVQAYNNMVQSWKNNQRQSISMPKKTETSHKQQQPYKFEQCTPKPFSQIKDSQRGQSDQKTNLFSKYTNQLVLYQKSKFILEELVEVLEQSKVLDLTNHRTIQFLYLLCFRAWVDINFAINTFAPFKLYDDKNPNNPYSGSNLPSAPGNFLSNPQQQNLKLLAIPMYKLQQRIEKVLLFYHKSLSFREGLFKNRLKSFVDFIFRNSKKTFRDKVLFGVEGADFSRDQQINYTYESVIPLIRKQLLSQMSPGKVNNKMRIILLAYPKIMRIQMHKLQSFDWFETIKSTIIKQEETKISVKPVFV